MIPEAPYPGLRPFHRDEAHLFFGREEQTDELLRRLQQTHFLAAIGPSGCGKSSLVRAGMIAALETGYMVEAGSRWQIATLRPGSQPIQSLATALIDETSLAPDESVDRIDAVGFLAASLRRGPTGLIEALQMTPPPPGQNLLILVDQFEEIFRFHREEGGDEANAFVSILLESARSRDTPIYVVITMRSDFLGDCALFAGLPEMINSSQFLTPRLSREQRKAAITGPARVHNGDVEPSLVNHLLNEMGSDPDRLPVMQHLLMRMWTDRGADQTTNDESPAPNFPPPVLTMEDYERVGGFDHALSNHADEAINSLSEEQKLIAQSMFRRLSERGDDNREIRRPTPCGEIASLCGVSVEDVVSVVDVFRAPGVSFLVPAWPQAIETSDVLDISHESLIRCWDRLKEWTGKEAQSAETYRFLEQTARRWQEDKAALWGTPNLELALDWKEREKPTDVWSQRYGGDFLTAIAFLDASEAARHDAERAAVAKQQRQVRKFRNASFTMAGAFLLLLTGISVFLYGWILPHTSYYNTYFKRWGKPIGYGALSEDDVGRRGVSLRFTRDKGRFGEVNRVEAVDQYGNCTHKHGIGTYLEYAPETKSPVRECAWDYIYDHRGRIIYENAYNKFNNLVYAFAYVPTIEEMPVRYAYYVGSDGFPKPRKNSSAEIVEFRYDPKTGDEVRFTYWDRNQRPQRALDQAYGQAREYYENGLFRKITSLDADGSPMNDTSGNASLEIFRDHLGDSIEAQAFDKHGNPVLLKVRYHRNLSAYDENGNLVEDSYFDIQGDPVFSSYGYHRATYEYNERGNQTAVAYFGLDGEPVLVAEGYHFLTNDYDGSGKVIAAEYFGLNREPVLISEGYHHWTDKHDERGNVVETAFFGLDGESILTTEGFIVWRANTTNEAR